jgi:hypothetical protein
MLPKNWKLKIYIFTLLPLALNGQTERKAKLDSAYFDPFLYPAVSIVMVPNGFFEVNSFNNLLTATKVFDNNADLVENNARTSSLNQILQITSGIGKAGRVNVGLDLNYNSFRVDLDTEASPFKVFGSSKAYIKQNGLNSIGLRIRYLPVKNSRKFVVQHTFQIPAKSANQYYFNNQAVHVLELNRKLYLFSQLQLSIGLPKDVIKTTVLVPLTEIISYLINPKLQLYGLVSHLSQFGRVNDKNFAEQFNGTQIGAGIQYQPSLRFGLTLYESKFVRGKNFGSFWSSNLGLRVII